MGLLNFSVWQWLVLVQQELLLFAGVFFLLGALDEWSIDIVYLWLRLTGRARDERLNSTEEAPRPLSGPVALFIPAWQEAEVIGVTIRHTLMVWPHRELTLYIGCYCNDRDTIAVVEAAAAMDDRVRLVVNDRAGPTTKADCLNTMYAALLVDEQKSGYSTLMVVLHDAEDMVDTAALNLLDREMARADFVQLPVLPLPQDNSPWIGSHYCEEFAEAHGKVMVVRNVLGAGIPGAGVGCAVARPMLARISAVTGDAGPFAADCLTEDYELGLTIGRMGGRAKFLRARCSDDRLVATRAYFPSDLKASVRQKTRWLQGIAFDGWDRLGWSGNAAERWMRLRDRRGPLTALILAVAYLLLLLGGIGWLANLVGYGIPLSLTPAMWVLLILNTISFIWRTLLRFAYTAREYGMMQGLQAILRIPVTNIIAIMAGRRALVAYCKTLRGQAVVWDQTSHSLHPTSGEPKRVKDRRVR